MTFDHFEKLNEAQTIRNQLQEALNNITYNLYTIPAQNNGGGSKDYHDYLDKAVSPFIEDHINLIDENNFTKLYEEAESYLTPDLEHATPYLTEYLISCDINPLEYMKKVPREYISGSQDSVIHIPDNIEVIEAQSLNSHNLKHIVLPKNLTQLALHFNTFGSTNNIYLHYPGKESDWKSVCITEGMDGREYDVYVTCEEDGYKQKYGKPNIDVSSVAYNSKWAWGSISNILNDMKTRWELKLDDLKDTYTSYFDED